jgi:hypothetical protein
MAIPPDKSPDRITPGKPLDQVGKPVTPGGAPEGFESYMQGAGTKTPSGTPQTPGGPTPMNAVRPGNLPTAAPTMDSLSMQAKNAHDTLGTVEKQLKDKNLQLKRSQSHLVRQKLGDANNYLRAAGSKLGTPPSQERNLAGLSGVSRFVAMINEGQDQLLQVQQQLHEMSARGANVSPADMMTIQVKMGLAQQEIEYTSTLLSKVIQSVTQIMNTQL